MLSAPEQYELLITIAHQAKELLTVRQAAAELTYELQNALATIAQLREQLDKQTGLADAGKGSKLETPAHDLG